MAFNTKEKHNAYHKKYRASSRDALKDILGKVCVKCGFDDIRALQIDHIFGGGTKEFRGKTAHGKLKLIKASPERYQLLCANCNWIKRYENGELPYYSSKP